MKLKIICLGLALTDVPITNAEISSCNAVRFSNVGQSSIAAVTGRVSFLLKRLSYQLALMIAWVSIIFMGFKSRQINVLLSDSNSTMMLAPGPLIRAGSIKLLDIKRILVDRIEVGVTFKFVRKFWFFIGDTSKIVRGNT